MSLGVASITLAVLATLHANISQTAARISRANQNIVATTKVYAALSAALRSRERNRLSFATQIGRPPLLRLPSGGAHPLGALIGATRPREGSDILTVVDVAHRCRGSITKAIVSGDAVTATACGLACRVQPDEFKSYLLYSIDGARQVVGEVSSLSDSCVEVRGTAIAGVVGARRAFTSSPIIFAPVEREYSLFVDTTDTFRIASHVGPRIVENQPVAQGIESIDISSDQRERGVTTFAVVVRPRLGKELSTFIIPGLAERWIWNEVLP